MVYSLSSSYYDVCKGRCQFPRNKKEQEYHQFRSTIHKYTDNLGREKKTCVNIFYREFTGGNSGLSDFESQNDRLREGFKKKKVGIFQ